MSDQEDKLKRAVSSGTAIIFLNIQWLGQLKERFEDNELLDPTLAELIENAKRENRAAFQELNKLLKE